MSRETFDSPLHGITVILVLERTSKVVRLSLSMYTRDFSLRDRNHFFVPPIANNEEQTYEKNGKNLEKDWCLTDVETTDVTLSLFFSFFLRK